MRLGQRAINLPVMVAYVGLMLGLACEPHRYYDAYYSDYHPWNHDEIGFYAQWEVETRRPHQDFDRRSVDEQKEYFGWRHAHADPRDTKSRDDHRDHDNH
jgi:hypothetical protein